MGGLLVNIVIAPTFDNTKSFEESNDDYGTITITNNFGMGDPIAKYTLLENSEICLSNCYAIGEAVLYEDAILFSDFDFESDEGRAIELNYDLYIEVNESYFEEIKEYKKQCNTFELNGTQECYEIIVNSYNVTKYRTIWKPYYNTELKAGVYKWKLDGKKIPNEPVDWIGNSLGVKLDEWAWWNSTCNYKTPVTVTPKITDGNMLLNISLDTTGAHWEAYRGGIYVYDTTNSRELAWFNHTAFNNVNTEIWTNDSVTAGTPITIDIYYDCGTKDTVKYDHSNITRWWSRMETVDQIGDSGTWWDAVDNNFDLSDSAYEGVKASYGNIDAATDAYRAINVNGFLNNKENLTFTAYFNDTGSTAGGVTSIDYILLANTAIGSYIAVTGDVGATYGYDGTSNPDNFGYCIDGLSVAACHDSGVDRSDRYGTYIPITWIQSNDRIKLYIDGNLVYNGTELDNDAVAIWSRSQFSSTSYQDLYIVFSNYGDDNPGYSVGAEEPRVGNVGPVTPYPIINVSGTSNVSSVSAYCNFLCEDDDDGDVLTYNVSWLKGGSNLSSGAWYGIHNLTFGNVSCSNGTYVAAELDSGNLSNGQIWWCSVMVYDGSDYTTFVNSSYPLIIGGGGGGTCSLESLSISDGCAAYSTTGGGTLIR